MNWNQPKCGDCWASENPGREASRIDPAYVEEEKCSSCGRATRSGIYVRQHPDEVQFPAEEED